MRLRPKSSRRTGAGGSCFLLSLLALSLLAACGDGDSGTAARGGDHSGATQCDRIEFEGDLPRLEERTAELGGTAERHAREWVVELRAVLEDHDASARGPRLVSEAEAGSEELVSSILALGADGCRLVAVGLAVGGLSVADARSAQARFPQLSACLASLYFGLPPHMVSARVRIVEALSGACATEDSLRVLSSAASADELGLRLTSLAAAAQLPNHASSTVRKIVLSNMRHPMPEARVRASLVALSHSMLVQESVTVLRAVLRGDALLGQFAALDGLKVLSSVPADLVQDVAATLCVDAPYEWQSGVEQANYACFAAFEVVAAHPMQAFRTWLLSPAAAAPTSDVCRLALALARVELGIPLSQDINVVGDALEWKSEPPLTSWVYAKSKILGQIKRGLAGASSSALVPQIRRLLLDWDVGEDAVRTLLSLGDVGTEAIRSVLDAGEREETLPVLVVLTQEPSHILR